MLRQDALLVGMAKPAAEFALYVAPLTDGNGHVPSRSNVRLTACATKQRSRNAAHDQQTARGSIPTGSVNGL
jgi:hypothetical protein